jgi:hypothetical protein
MLLGGYVSELRVPSDVVMATTPSMSPVSILLWREHITSLRVGTSGAEDADEPRSIRAKVTGQWNPMPRGSGAASAWRGH